jgi:predicted nucleotidyltransferase component of viral defense system
MQLKARIKNIANKNKIRPQLIMQLYVLERLLKRISESEYQENFVLKGGFLISALVGLNTRTTKDLDTTIKGLKLSKEVIVKVFREICPIDCGDGLEFELKTVEETREGDDYPGLRAKFTACFETLKVPLFIDITTGDKITPQEIEFEIPSMFADETIKVKAYNLETLLAEKLETILSRGVANTRPRDFYDIYILVKLHGEELKREVLKKALFATATKRETLDFIENYQEILKEIFQDDRMISFWEGYRKEFNYAENIQFGDLDYIITGLLDELNR